MRKKWATLGYQILRISHFLRVIAWRGLIRGHPRVSFPASTAPQAIDHRRGSKPLRFDPRRRGFPRWGRGAGTGSSQGLGYSVRPRLLCSGDWGDAVALGPRSSTTKWWLVS